MKKLTLLCVALILSLGVGEASAQQQKNASDSLAYILGATQGVGLHRDVVKAQGAAATKEYCSDFIRGIKDVVLTDTIQTGYIDGVETGLVFLKELVRMQAHGKGVSHQIFVETLEKFFYDDTVNEAQFNTMLNDMRRQMEPVIEAYRARQEQTEKAAKEALENCPVLIHGTRSHNMDSSYWYLVNFFFDGCQQHFTHCPSSRVSVP